LPAGVEEPQPGDSRLPPEAHDAIRLGAFILEHVVLMLPRIVSLMPAALPTLAVSAAAGPQQQTATPPWRDGGRAMAVASLTPRRSHQRICMMPPVRLRDAGNRCKRWCLSRARVRVPYRAHATFSDWQRVARRRPADRAESAIRHPDVAFFDRCRASVGLGGLTYRRRAANSTGLIYG
jgi:hypothetical protein